MVDLSCLRQVTALGPRNVGLQANVFWESGCKRKLRKYICGVGCGKTWFQNRWHPKRDFGARLEPEGAQKEHQSPPKRQNGAQGIPTGTKMERKGCQRTPNGAKRMPKGSQGATQMHKKIDVQKRSPKCAKLGGYPERFGANPSKIDANIAVGKVWKINENY